MKKLAIVLPAIAAMGAAPAPAPLAFVACPIMRDTNTVPCWLADYNGQRYFLVIQEDATAAIYPPSLGHQALIEGAPTGETRCGGQVLTDLHISILPERDPSCDTILPASDQFQITDNPRGPGPSNARPPAPPAAPPPSGPAAEPKLTGSQKFEVHYDFDWQTAGRDARVIQQAAAYAIANPEAKVNVIGYRAAVKLSDGRVLSETDTIALRRANELADTLVTLGVDKDNINAAGEPDAVLGDYTQRLAIIAVVMSGSNDPDSEY